MKVKIKRLSPLATLPSRQHSYDAGYDVTSVEEITIPAGKWALVKTGIAVELPEDMEIQIRSRSGLALRHGIFCLNAPGTVDAGYRTEIGVILANFSQEDFFIHQGDRIAQLIFQTPKHPDLIEVNDLSDSERGLGGFGSTGW
ncbi:MAG: dUTP diphosphatase [Candidatus Marinimicrobia bacterium]|nr:dUTP diphosphatase [Candidatus Neomarinimicrobiota bacterium]